MTVREANSNIDYAGLQSLWDAGRDQITWYEAGAGSGLRWSDYDIHIFEDARGLELAVAARPMPLTVLAGSVAVDVTHRIETFIGPRDSVLTVPGAAAFLRALRDILRAWLPTLPPDAVVYGMPPAAWPHRTYFLSGATPRGNVLPLPEGRLLIWQRADTLLARA